MRRFLSIFASVTFWMIVALLVLGSTALSVGLAIVLAVVTIVVHVTIANLPEDPKKSSDQSQVPQQDNPKLIAPKQEQTTKKTDPDQAYFEQVSRVVEDLMLQCDYACNSPKFKEALDKSGFQLNMGILPLQYKRKVQELF